MYGYVNKLGDALNVYSKLDIRTKISLYIPRYTKPERSNSDLVKTRYSSQFMGDETILVVDDETALIELTCKILKSYGYQTF